MFGFLTSLFGGGSMVKAIESVALESIDTVLEKSEAQTMMVKALDANGAMRRDMSSNLGRLYTIYVVITLIIVLAQAFGIGDNENLKLAVGNILELFMPITGLYGVIVSASFGVNAVNSFSVKPKFDMDSNRASRKS